MFKDARDEAIALFQRGDFQGAYTRFMRLLDENPDDPHLWFYIGTIHLKGGMDGAGVGTLMHAASLKPNFYEALTNLGLAYRRLMRNDEAMAAWEMALQSGEGPSRSPKEDAVIYAMMGGVYTNAGEPEKALPFYQKGLGLDPDNTDCRHNMALAYLEMGQWKEGWLNYDYAIKTGGRLTKPYGVPVWEGEKGGTVIVCGEQGIGDEIMYASMLPDLQKDVDRIVLDCHPRLEKTFKRHYEHVHPTRKSPVVDWVKDYPGAKYLLIGSLGRHYRNSADAFPRTPYLTAPKWEPPRPTKGKMRIGIAWSGGTLATNARDRSLTLQELAPILEASPDSGWYSLQYTPEAARDVCALEEKTGIRISHYPDWVETYDYDKTFSFVAGMDLVISVCTTVVHVAGSLGIPCWCLTPKKVAWRYGLTGDMPWYGSVKCYRQTIPGKWADVIERVAADLK